MLQKMHVLNFLRLMAIKLTEKDAHCEHFPFSEPQDSLQKMHLARTGCRSAHPFTRLPDLPMLQKMHVLNFLRLMAIKLTEKDAHCALQLPFRSPVHRIPRSPDLTTLQKLHVPRTGCRSPPPFARSPVLPMLKKMHVLNFLRLMASKLTEKDAYGALWLLFRSPVHRIP